jgi:RNA polymerase sigma-70 factor (ECF subfamily)
MLRALKDCLERLSSRDQELLFVRYATDRPLKEYAENLRRSPGTLKARLFQIRENLRKSIEARLKEADPVMVCR